jgi:hypothetical protein
VCARPAETPTPFDVLLPCTPAPGRPDALVSVPVIPGTLLPPAAPDADPLGVVRGVDSSALAVATWTSTAWWGPASVPANAAVAPPSPPPAPPPSLGYAGDSGGLVIGCCCCVVMGDRRLGVLRLLLRGVPVLP